MSGPSRGNSETVAGLGQMGRECLTSTQWPEALLLLDFQGTTESKAAEQKACS